MQQVLINVSDIDTNDGQIEGLPANPRFIRDSSFESLKKSIQEDPDMLELREVLLFPHNNRFVVIGGNMRFQAVQELGYEMVTAKVLPADMPVEKLKRIVIKDNGAWGQWDWDAIANEWSEQPLSDWGMDVPADFSLSQQPQFEPELVPETTYAEVSDADVEKTASDLEGQMKGEQKLQQVICPHCGEEFEIDPTV